MILKKIALALPLLLALPFSATAFADTWNVDPDRSKLGFEVKQGNGTVTGMFATWTANIDFDPETPDAAKISAQVKASSAATGNPQFDGTLPGKDWFDVDGFPEAEFRTDKVALVGDNSYSADGILTIKGIEHPVKLDFTLNIDGDTAKAEGKATVKRLDYKLGAGVGTDAIADAVTVTLDLTAIR